VFRQLMTVFAAAAICAACGSDAPPEGQVGHVEENFGGVVSDEPRSALVGRDILSAGGNAIDAAVATYFTLAVTYPGAATLGGGGYCVVYPGGSDGVEAIDFRPALFSSGSRAVMIPGAVRGMFALHARYGRLQWAALLLPAERLARFGNGVPRAFARQIAALPDEAFADPGLRRILAPDGKPLGEGDMLRQTELSTTLAGIRVRGPGEFYTGDLAKTLAADLGRTAGIEVPVTAFRSYRPKWSKTEIVDIGKNELHLPAGPVGKKAAEIWRALADKRVPAPIDRKASFDSAGFVATDLSGGAVSCVVTSNGTLGAARMIGSSGIIAAAPPPTSLSAPGRASGRASGGEIFPGLPMVYINKPLKDARGAVAGSGGTVGALRALSTAVNAFSRDFRVERAFGAPPKPGPRISKGRANIIFCPQGAREEPELCGFATDPMGHGLAVSAVF
jgi:gamma-glutamyltranspeptidase / glutathione hydrolase